MTLYYTCRVNASSSSERLLTRIKPPDDVITSSAGFAYLTRSACCHSKPTTKPTSTMLRLAASSVRRSGLGRICPSTTRRNSTITIKRSVPPLPPNFDQTSLKELHPVSTGEVFGERYKALSLLGRHQTLESMATFDDEHATPDQARFLSLVSSALTSAIERLPLLGLQSPCRSRY